jgi:hypothetical protein
MTFLASGDISLSVALMGHLRPVLCGDSAGIFLCVMHVPRSV